MNQNGELLNNNKMPYLPKKNKKVMSYNEY